ncbi:hypothetical protein MAR_015954, partial [Mya arenaria]
MVCGVKLTKSFYTSLLDKSAWLLSDHINIYLNTILKKSQRKIHLVDNVWFVKSLFKNNNLQQLCWLINEVESQVYWFDKDIIVIPINENNTHWTLAIVLVKEETIIYSNSYGDNANTQYTDTSSCGVYVCAVSYAVIFQSSLPYEPNLAGF